MDPIKFAWPAKSHPPVLNAECVHVWSVPLVVSADRLADFAALLSDDEKTRAERYRFDDIRERFVACRGQIRSILGRYVDEPPDRIQFQYGGLGKPSLAPRWNDFRIEFNVSNSGDIGLLAVSLNRVLGVDVERIRPIENLRGMIDRYFAPSEKDVLRSYHDDACESAFYSAWTRKEAVMKATSMGLSISPEDVEVTVSPSESVRVVDVHDDRSQFDQWWLQHLTPADGYVAALASPGEPAAIKMWNWECHP